MQTSAIDLIHEVLSRQDFRSIQLVQEFQDVNLVVDPGQIRQVMGNLVTNAIQAMPDGGSLTIRILKNGRAAYIEVADTGHGMTQETLAKIFQPLFTTKAKGIGLGLSVCESLVRVNGGSIRVVSIPGQGSTFTLELPIAD
jgi:signal transduction histidine kinase